jgi:cytidine deaminase
MAEDVAGVNHAKLAACVAIRSDIVAFGYNQLRTHPFAARFGKNEFAPYWHAETHAIHNSLRRISIDDLTRATLYVVRVKRPSERATNWVLGLSRPCRGCRKCIFEFGVPRVCYSTDDDGFFCEEA